MVSKLTVEAAEELHRIVFEDLTDRIKNGDETVIEHVSEGETRVTRTRTKTSPAVLAVAAKILKDNAVFLSPEQSSATAGLEEALARRGRRPSKADLKNALASIGQEMLQ